MQPKNPIAKIPQDRISGLVVMKKNLLPNFEESLANILEIYGYSGNPEAEHELRRVIDEADKRTNRLSKGPNPD